MKKATVFLLTLFVFLAGCTATGNSQTEQIEYNFRNVNFLLHYAIKYIFST